MASTAYERGRRFEYRVRDYFVRLGYVVVRSPKSKSPVDVFVMGHQTILFVQCKLGGYLPPDEWNALIDMCDKCGALPVLAINNRRKLEFYQLMTRKMERGRTVRLLLRPLKNEKTRAAA